MKENKIKIIILILIFLIIKNTESSKISFETKIENILNEMKKINKNEFQKIIKSFKDTEYNPSCEVSFSGCSKINFTYDPRYHLKITREVGLKREIKENLFNYQHPLYNEIQCSLGEISSQQNKIYLKIVIHTNLIKSLKFSKKNSRTFYTFH
jgi:hypothetical protein